MGRTAERLRFPTREESVLAELLALRAAATPEKPFLLFGDEQWSYGRAAREAWRSGNGLASLGVGRGDCVSVWLPTGPDVLRAWFGANALGAVYAPLNVAARGRYLEHTMNLAESKLLVAHAQLLDRLVDLDLPHLETVVVAGAGADVELPWPTVTLDELLDGATE